MTVTVAWVAEDSAEEGLAAEDLAVAMGAHSRQR